MTRGLRHGKRSALGLVVIGTGLGALGFAALAATEFRFTGDTEHYVGLARSIARGDGLRLSTWRDTQFPPGFPFVLAPAAWLFDGSFAAVSRWAAILASLVFPLTWLYLRRRGDWLALPIAILTTCTVRFLDLATDNPMSDAVYLALSLALFIWADHGTSPGNGPRGCGSIIIGCLLLIALPAVRAIGISAIAAAALVLPLRGMTVGSGRRHVLTREAIPVVAAVVTLGVWASLVHQGSGGYLHDLLMSDPHHPDLGPVSLGQILERVARNVGAQVARFDELLVPWLWINPTWYTPALVAVAILVIGWWRSVRGWGCFAALYALCYVGILLLWPYEEGARFLLPLLPLLWLYLFEGLRALLEALRAGHRWLHLAGLSWAGLAMIALALVFRLRPAAFHQQEAVALVFWVAAFIALLLGWEPLGKIARRLTTRRVRFIVDAGVVLFAAGSLAYAGPRIVARARGDLPLPDAVRPLSEASRWIAATTPLDALILTTYASRIGFASGRPTRRLTVTLAPDRFLELERRYHPQFLVIVESPHDTYYVPNDVQKFAVLETLFAGRLDRVHHFDGGSIYAFAPRR